MWIGLGRYDSLGWLLWALVWAQTAASILHAYMRLEQRTLDTPPDRTGRFRMGWLALVVTASNVAAVAGLGMAGVVPRWLFLPYSVQFAETVWGVFRPAIGVRPKAIGLRQLAVSSLFTLLFIWIWSG
jgi:hypothetical protein